MTLQVHVKTRPLLFYGGQLDEQLVVLLDIQVVLERDHRKLDGLVVNEFESKSLKVLPLLCLIQHPTD